MLSLPKQRTNKCPCRRRTLLDMHLRLRSPRSRHHTAEFTIAPLAAIVQLAKCVGVAWSLHFPVQQRFTASGLLLYGIYQNADCVAYARPAESVDVSGVQLCERCWRRISLSAFAKLIPRRVDFPPWNVHILCTPMSPYAPGHDTPYTCRNILSGTFRW